MKRLFAPIGDEDHMQRALFDFLARDETLRLHALREAMGQWSEVATGEFEARYTHNPPHPDLQDLGFDPMADDGQLMIDTERALYGVLAVAVMAAVEVFFGRLCKSEGVDLSERATWSEKRNAVEKRLGIDCASLPGIDEVTRVRIIGNCFKHSGVKDKNYLAKYEGTVKEEENEEGAVEEEIEYEKEDWKGTVDRIGEFLMAVAAKIPG